MQPQNNKIEIMKYHNVCHKISFSGDFCGEMEILFDNRERSHTAKVSSIYPAKILVLHKTKLSILYKYLKSILDSIKIKAMTKQTILEDHIKNYKQMEERQNCINQKLIMRKTLDCHLNKSIDQVERDKRMKEHVNGSDNKDVRFVMHQKAKILKAIQVKNIRLKKGEKNYPKITFIMIIKTKQI